MNQRPITAKQKEILEFIIKYIHDNNIAPTVRDICKHFNFASPKSAQDQLAALEKKGYISRLPNSKRTIRLTSRALSLKQLGTIPAGKPAELEQGIESEIEIILRLKKRYPDCFIVKVQGESMIEAGILNGDYAIISKEAEVLNGDIAAVLIDNKVTLKRIKQVDGQLYLVSANPSVKDIKISESIYIVGKLVGIYREI
ncbi:MAG: transcriptional repressor LexA [Planctomycetota bacterium]